MSISIQAVFSRLALLKSARDPVSPEKTLFFNCSPRKFTMKS